MWVWVMGVGEVWVRCGGLMQWCCLQFQKITTTASPVILCLATGMPAVTCCSYAHPANWMWRILSKTGIAPPCVRGAQDDDLMPALAGEALAVDPWTCLALSSRVALHLAAKPLFLKSDGLLEVRAGVAQCCPGMQEWAFLL